MKTKQKQLVFIKLFADLNTSIEQFETSVDEIILKQKRKKIAYDKRKKPLDTVPNRMLQQRNI